MMQNKLAPMLALGAALAITAGSASAAVDVTAAVTEIGTAVGPVGLIGGAVLLVLATIATFKWVRRAF